MTRTARNLARGGTVSLLLAATNSRFGVCSAVALLATVCVPVSASALSTTPTQDFTLAVPSTGFSGGNLIFDTSTITPLNPTLGALISVTYTLNGNINWDVKGLSGGTDSLDIAFLSLNTGATATTTGAVSIPISFCSTTTSPNGDLSIFEGTGPSVNFEGLGGRIQMQMEVIGLVHLTQWLAQPPLPAPSHTTTLSLLPQLRSPPPSHSLPPASARWVCSKRKARVSL